MSNEKLFKPVLEDNQNYGRNLTDLFYKLEYSPYEEVQPLLNNTVTVGKIPFAMRAIGIPAGNVGLLPQNIPHMIGFGQEKTSVHYRNMHNLNLEEMLAIPYMISDPDMVFRSNTQPNSSIILCKEVESRGKPIVLAMKISIQDSLNSAGIIVSGYEKDNSPESFFSNLYKHGYCIYDGESSEYFNGIKTGSGAKDHLPGPIPASAFTCTDPKDKSLSPKGISPSDTPRILTKSYIVNKYRENSKELIAIFHESRDIAISIDRNLSELGYHTIIPHSITDAKEVATIAKNCTGIACGKKELPSVEKLKAKIPSIEKAGEFPSFMPQPIFKHQMKTLQETMDERNAPERRLQR